MGEPKEEAACALKGRREGWEPEPSEEQWDGWNTGKAEARLGDGRT